MRFVKLLGTFKNGLISPRLRGTVENEKEVFNSAEELTNFYVDKVGAVNKRAPIVSGDSLGAIDVYGRQVFSVNFLGTDYNLVFNWAISSFSNTDGNYSSFFLVINQGAEYVEVINSKPRSNPNMPQISHWKGQYTTDGEFIPSGLDQYLSKFDPFTTYGNRIIQYEKVTERTVVFTTKSFSFTVSLLDYTDTVAGNLELGRKFVMLPYFVSIPLFLESFGRATPPISSKCYICPSNFPFNAINPDTTLGVNFSIIVGTSGANQQGALPSDGVVSKHNERFVWSLTAPRSMGNLEGRFISVPNAASTKDVVFFITLLEYGSSAVYTYRCIQVIGGTPLANTSLWRLSTWGDEVGHPKAVGYCFGRLIYGNSGINANQWWASATHPAQPLYFQGFMQDNLRQDASSDTSGIYYNDITTYTGGDFYRFGFTDFVPNMSAISWIKSRRRIHFGTVEGECQLQITANSGFGALSYEQTKVGSNSSGLFQAVEGDRKIFYIANNQRDIRFISTEDRDYESIDGLVTTLQEGLKHKYKRIEWYEAENALLCLTEDNKLYVICIHSDTEIKAMSYFDFGYPVLDISANYSKITLLLNVDNQYCHCTLYNYAEDDTMSGYAVSDPFEFYGDFSEVQNTPTLRGENPWLAERLVNIYFKGVVYTNFQTGNILGYLYSPISGADPLPFDADEISIDNPAIFYRAPITARIKSMPFNEGAQYGSAVGSIHRVDRVTFQVDNSGPFKAGESFTNMHSVEGLDSTPKTGLFRQDFPQSPDIERVLCVESTTPTPLHISGVSLRGVSYEGE